MDAGLNEVKVETSNNPRRLRHGPVNEPVNKRPMPKVSSRRNDGSYVNSAYSGSLDSVSVNTNSISLETAPPTSVIREQYWTCSKWPLGQRVLAIAVGVLIGVVVGLVITVTLRGNPGDLGGFFRLAPG